MSPLLPYDLEIEAEDQEHFLILERGDRSLSGRLTLPYIDVHGAINFADLEIPTSGTFTQDDLMLLWEAGRELADWRARAAIVGTVRDPATPEIRGLASVVQSWRVLEDCSHNAAALLTNWPRVLDRRSAWLPVPIPGGFEDLERTERDADQLGYAAEDGSVNLSARWLGATRALKSTTVSAMADAVVQLVMQTVHNDIDRLAINQLLQPIGAVAYRGDSWSPSQDPDPSSWPTAFTSFVTSCMRVIVELAVSTAGSGALPLLNTSELYEAWLAIEVRSALDGRFGMWTPGRSGSHAQWESDACTFDLWIKPVLNSSPRVLGAETFCSVVADQLTPDLILSATRGDYTELAVIDAKAWRSMLPEDVLSEGSKYLYGIRRANNVATVPTLTRAAIVTCAPAPTLRSEPLTRLSATTATPTLGHDHTRRILNDTVDALIASLSERERGASLNSSE